MEMVRTLRAETPTMEAFKSTEVSTWEVGRLVVDKVLGLVKTMGQERTMELDLVGRVRAWDLLAYRTKLDKLAVARVMEVESPMGAVRFLEASGGAGKAVACLVEVRLKLPAQLGLLVPLKVPVLLRVPALRRQQRSPHKRLALLSPLDMQRKLPPMLLSLLKLSRLRRNPLKLNLLKLNLPKKLNPLMPRTQVTRMQPFRTLIRQIQEATQAVEIQE
jgi:hypothetical protein